MRVTAAWLTAAAALSLVMSPLACGGGAKHFGGDEPGSGGAAGAGDHGGGVGSGSGGESAAGNGGGVGARGGEVGSGGRTGTGGGIPMTGGAGGATAGTGGQASGSGGLTAGGGRVGTGGMGTGGGAGAGSGQAGTGGMVGTGGAPGTGGSGADCTAIAAAYDAEMPKAKMCGTTGGILGTECKSVVSARLGCGSECFTYVDDSKRLNEIAAQWSAGGCLPARCTAVACQNPTGVKCVASSGLLTGMCTDLN